MQPGPCCVEGGISCMFPLFAASPRDPGKTPGKVWSVEAAVLMSDVWAHFFLWDDWLTPLGNSVKAAAGPEKQREELVFALFVAFI